MAASDVILKDLETALAGVTGKLKQDLGAVRSNRPSPEMVQDIKINMYGQQISIRELGSLSVLPPRTIQISLWDQEAVAAIVKAIESAHLGLTVSNEGLNIRATLSPLGDERREEITKLVKKTAEAARIQVRGRRDEIMKRLRDAEGKKEVTEDEAFKAKDRIQKAVDKANGDVEVMMNAKLAELGAG